MLGFIKGWYPPPHEHVIGNSAQNTRIVLPLCLTAKIKSHFPKKHQHQLHLHIKEPLETDVIAVIVTHSYQKKPRFLPPLPATQARTPHRTPKRKDE